MFRITIECMGIPTDAGPSGAADIEKEFRDHRRWWLQPKCTYVDGKISLTVTSDFDADGKALSDEFSDCLSAYLRSHGAIHIRSVERI
jgi:hypothetical protein